MACDFNSDMGAVDRRLLDGLLPVLASKGRKPRFIYTGGGASFGATDDELVIEETPFRPPPAFAWMVPQLRRVLASTVDGIARAPPAWSLRPRRRSSTGFARAAAEGRGRARHRRERSGALGPLGTPKIRRISMPWRWSAPRRARAIGAAMEGYPVGRIARAFARRFETRLRRRRSYPPDTIAAELGEWAGAMRSTSGSAATKPAAISAGRRNISIRKARSPGLSERPIAFASR